MIEKFIDNIKSELVSIAELDIDNEQVKSQVLKRAIDKIRADKIASLISFCDDAVSRLKIEEQSRKKVDEQESKPMYFDILRANGSIDAHIFSLSGASSILKPGDRVIRTYNSKNCVLNEYENAKYLCPDYNDAFNVVLSKIKKQMNSDERGKLGITTILNEYPEYAKTQEQLISKEELDAIELPEDEKLPKKFVDTCLKFDDPKAILTKEDVWDSAISEVSTTKPSKKRNNKQKNVKKTSKVKKASTKKTKKGSK